MQWKSFCEGAIERFFLIRKKLAVSVSIGGNWKVIDCADRIGERLEFETNCLGLNHFSVEMVIRIVNNP